MNTDGSLINGLAGGGVIIRNSQGGFVAASSYFFSTCTIYEAEVRAILQGLRLCQTLGLHSVIVESDSKAVVDALSGQTTIPWKYMALFHHIQLLISPTICIFHIYREANCVADSLAKTAITNISSSSYSFTTLPRFVIGLLALDQRGFPSIRLRKFSM